MKPLHFLAISALGILAGCDKPAAPAEKSTVLALVGTRAIQPADLIAETQRRVREGQPVPDKAILLQEMVQEETLVQQALARGLDKDPEVARTWRSLLIGTLKSRELDPKLESVAISPAEVAAFYQANPAAFAQPEQARLGLIFAALPPNAPAAAVAPVRDRMAEARKLAATGAEGFKQAAAKFSEHQGSRYRGGDVGWVVREKPPGYLPPTVVEAACGLADGAVSEVLEAKGGLYLVTLLDRRPAATRPLAEVEGFIRANLTKQRREAAQRDFAAKLEQAAKVTLFPDALQALELPAAPPTNVAPPASPRTASN